MKKIWIGIIIGIVLVGGGLSYGMDREEKTEELNSSKSTIVCDETNRWHCYDFDYFEKRADTLDKRWEMTKGYFGVVEYTENFCERGMEILDLDDESREILRKNFREYGNTDNCRKTYLTDDPNKKKWMEECNHYGGNACDYKRGACYTDKHWLYCEGLIK